MDAPRARTPAEVEYGELPELTRALRALGSPRHSGAHQQSAAPAARLHEQFFAPLIAARRQATGSASPEAMIRAFDTAQLARDLDRALDRIVAEWPDARTAARRAVRTGLRERADEYVRALEALHTRATDALGATGDQRLPAWRAWTAQLAATFDAADRCWIALRAVVERLPNQSR